MLERLLGLLSTYQSRISIVVNIEKVFLLIYFSFYFLTQIPCVVKAGLQLLLTLLAQFLSARVTGLHYYTWLSDSCEFRACGDFQSGQVQDPPPTQILYHQPPLELG